MDLENILDSIILFDERYFETSELPDPALLPWQQEELNSTFVYDDVKYYVYQVWKNDGIHYNYHITIYKDDVETTLTIFYLMTALAEIRHRKSMNKTLSQK